MDVGILGGMDVWEHCLDGVLYVLSCKSVSGCTEGQQNT